jgi:putative component of toxin-antitoxin plasmid stabilization module
MNFCYLEKDKKTFDILLLYIKDISDNEDLLKEDNKIQIKEIQEHNQRECRDASLEWIEKHAEGERIYLNTIKELAILFLCTEREVTWKNFIFFIDRLNSINESILNKIYI